MKATNAGKNRKMNILQRRNCKWPPLWSEPWCPSGLVCKVCRRETGPPDWKLSYAILLYYNILIILWIAIFGDLKCVSESECCGLFYEYMLGRPQRWSIFQSDGMVNVFFQATIELNGFSMVLTTLDHHHWMFFWGPNHWCQWFFDGFQNFEGNGQRWFWG